MSMKVLIDRTVDAKTQKEAQSDSEFKAGNAYLVKDEVGQLLIDRGFATKVERLRPIEDRKPR